MNYSQEIRSTYYDKLINMTFSLLPLYEEQNNTNSTFVMNKQHEVVNYLKSAFSDMNEVTPTSMDIVVRMKTLDYCSCHREYRKIILKVCHLLSLMRNEVTHGKS